ncbi:MAG: benzoate-CoA ligase family protein [Burkholderiaceae bacterium]|nr:benzoate-CoA ligase family protein [Burkholderiaceae bacterium]MEB2350962.1 benzoate-CoA ligase family protein [Burkholderiaceae bacterium]
MHPSAHIDTFARDNLPPPDLWPDLPQSADTRYPERLNAAVELLDRMVERGFGDAIALRTDTAACTYYQLYVRVNQVAHVLRSRMGLVPGNRVLLRGSNNPMMAACLLATIKAGLVAVPTMPLLRAKDLVPVVVRAKVSAALCDSALRDELGALMRETPSLKQAMFFNDGGGTPEALETHLAAMPTRFAACDTAQDDVALIAFTSGTTGTPKGTMHFHRDVVAMCDLFPRHVLRPQPDDVFCGTPPLAFTFGLGGMLCFPLRVGASVVLLDRGTPETLLAAIQRHRASVLFTAPTMYRQMAGLAGQFDLSSLKKCVSAGEALPDATRQLWKEATGIEIIDGIGSTEMIHIFVSSPPEAVRRGAIGKAVPGYRARIVDDEMNEVPPGTVGKLAVQGPTGCRYLADERQRNYVKNGWNLPGDTFTMDADGYFYYQARSDDMIVSSGYNIAGPEVEAALMLHEAVAECGVIGVPDEARGQIVKAFVVLKPGHRDDAAMATALQEFVKQTIAPYKYPRAVEFRDSLPRTETGKLQRFRLRTL